MPTVLRGIPKATGRDVAGKDAAPIAAGIVFVAPDGDVLVLRRSSTEKNYAGHWSLPGGKGDAGETATDAAVRECKEEIGLDVDAEAHGLKLLDRIETPNGMLFSTYAKAVDTKFTPTLNDEHAGYCWSALDSLPSPLHPAVARVLGEHIGVTGDMKPEEWDELRSGFAKWTREEEREPEHAIDLAEQGFDAEFNESDHPRDDHGRFGSGGGGSSGASSAQKSKISRGELRKKLEAMPSERLHASLKHPDIDQSIKKEIERELDERASSGGGERVKPSSPAPVQRPAAQTKKDDGLVQIGTTAVGSKLPFVQAFNKEFTTGQAKSERLKSTPDETLRKAFEAMKGHIDPSTNNVREYIVAEAKRRGLALDGAMAHQAADSMALDRDTVRTYDKDGNLHVARVRLTKANICPYRGEEIPGWEELGLDPQRIYQLFRAPEEIEKGAKTSNNIRLLEDHEPVSAKDPKQEIVVGSTGTDAEWDGTYLWNSLVVWTADAIAGIESEDKKELSAGYYYKPVMTPGTFMGMPYDGVMTEIVFNHEAIVAKGRVGADVVIGDSAMRPIWDLSRFVSPYRFECFDGA